MNLKKEMCAYFYKVMEQFLTHYLQWIKSLNEFSNQFTNNTSALIHSKCKKFQTHK